MPICTHCGHEGDDLGGPCPTDPSWRLVDEVHAETWDQPGVMLGRLVADRFALVRVLGKGGMGLVYEAVQIPIGRRVAVKVLRADYVGDELVRTRFFREARVLGMLQHVNLVTLYDYGVIEDGEERSLFIAMELLRGRTLTSALARPQSFGGAQVIQTARGIAAGLAEAHRNGIVHRDMKPDNVLLVRDGVGSEIVKLVDFGIARLSTANTVLTRTGMVFGTPAYMSPEQATGEPNVGPPADVYAFGVLLYRMLVGKLLFTGDAPLQILMQHINKPAHEIVLRPGVEVPASLLELTRHCLEKRPTARPADGRELEERLARIAVELHEGKNLARGADGDEPVEDAAAVASSPDRTDPAASTPEGDTWIVGGDVEVTQPDTPNAARAAAEPTEISGGVGAAAAYRVGPRSAGPAALRDTGKKVSKWPLVALVGAGVLTAIAIAIALLMGGGSPDSAPGAEKENATGAAPQDEGVVGSGEPEREGATPTAPPDAPTPVVEDSGAGEASATVAKPARSEAALRSRLAQLETALETALTIVDPAERAQRQRELQAEIALTKAALAQHAR